MLYFLVRYRGKKMEHEINTESRMIEDVTDSESDQLVGFILLSSGARLVRVS